MNGGLLADGTPYVAIGNDEPEANVLMVRHICQGCGNEFDFDFWAMFAGESIICPSCGRVSRRGPIETYDPRTGEWTASD